MGSAGCRTTGEGGRGARVGSGATAGVETLRADVAGAVAGLRSEARPDDAACEEHAGDGAQRGDSDRWPEGACGRRVRVASAQPFGCRVAQRRFEPVALLVRFTQLAPELVDGSGSGAGDQQMSVPCGASVHVARQRAIQHGRAAASLAHEARGGRYTCERNSRHISRVQSVRAKRLRSAMTDAASSAGICAAALAHRSDAWSAARGRSQANCRTARDPPCSRSAMRPPAAPRNRR